MVLPSVEVISGIVVRRGVPRPDVSDLEERGDEHLRILVPSGRDCHILVGHIGHIAFRPVLAAEAPELQQAVDALVPDLAAELDRLRVVRECDCNPDVFRH